MFKIIFLNIIITFLFAEHLITPIPIKISYNKEKALLGKELFWEKKLSPDQNMACIDCHNLLSNKLEKKKLLNKEKKLILSTPTVLNAIYNYKYFWDGRVGSLEEQVKETLTSGFLAKGKKKTFMSLLEAKYKNKFEKIYKDGYLFKNIVNALVEFQKVLVTPNSKFDRYLRGDKLALSEDELTGYEIFKTRGCIACHNGVNLGTNSYSKLKIVSAYKGCYGKIKNTQKYLFLKVPSLRNVSLKGSYFHDSSIVKLEDAIQGASTLALKRRLTIEDIGYLVLFLKTFTGDKPEILKEMINVK